MIKNTFPLPHPSKKNLDRRKLQIKTDTFPTKIPTEQESKICLSTVCVWCGKEFDGLRAVCPRCRNCQSCGLKSQSFKKCHLCNNEDPQEYPRTEKKVYRIF